MNIQMHSRKVLGNAKGAVGAHHHQTNVSAEMKIGVNSGVRFELLRHLQNLQGGSSS